MIPSDQRPPGEDWLVRRIVDLEREVRELKAGRRLEAASIGAGGVTVNGGAIDIKDGTLRLRHANGTDLLFLGPGVIGAEPVRYLRIRRPDGSTVLYTYGSDDGDGFWAMYDKQDNIILSDDGASGQGLARPYLPIPWASHSQSAITDTTTSAAFTGLLSTRYKKQHPKIWAQILCQASDATTAGEVRIIKTFTGDQIGATVTIPATGPGGFYALRQIGPADVPGTFSEEMELEVQARRTAGAGTIGVRMFGCYAQQS